MHNISNFMKEERLYRQIAFMILNYNVGDIQIQSIYILLYW